jgi:hypothetical protein
VNLDFLIVRLLILRVGLYSNLDQFAGLRSAGLKPGDEGKLAVSLEAGDYLLLCNHKEHYELGMSTPFTVTK